jgi:YD repeat-containing protein
VRQFDGGEMALTYEEQGPHDGRLASIRQPNGALLKYNYDSDNRVSSISCGDAYEIRFAHDDKGRPAGVDQVKAGI